MERDGDLVSDTRQRLRDLRMSAGWSLDELSARTGLSPSVISRIETGKRALSLDVLVVLADALGVDVRSLLGGRSKSRRR